MDFVKTSTGFGTACATVEDVALMRRVVGPEIGVKAAGGIRDLDTALALSLIHIYLSILIREDSAVRGYKMK